MFTSRSQNTGQVGQSVAWWTEEERLVQVIVYCLWTKELPPTIDVWWKELPVYPLFYSVSPPVISTTNDAAMKLKVLSFTAIKRPWQLQCRSFHKSSRHFDPLRILFCGSDDFSVASLEALNTERLAKSTADIESIDVVCRPGKPTGAGLRLIRHCGYE